jgi:UDP-N-acetylmuramoyl-L-alanyl-D-glutamate--2,6-diaminopimelate ligase
MKTAYIGTIGFYLGDEVVVLDNTTPDILDLYEMFLKCKEENIETIVMEVSSHAISYKRVEGLEFDIACFTNLTQDHLDYHKTMENYKNAKIKLFSMLRNDKVAIVNGDDPHYRDFMLESNNNVVYGINAPDYKILNYELHIDKTKFKLQNNNNVYDIEISLPGKYNIYNYLNAFISAITLGFSPNAIIEQSKTLVAPNGRFDIIKYKNAAVIIDYAHTPDAMENILSNVNEYKKGKIITIIGCGGDRDRTKRPIMGNIATTLSDYAIFTNDNPRTEDEKVIMNDIVCNLNATNYEIIYDRKLAIKKGMAMLEDNDMLMLLGKGHEDYQIIGKEKIHMSDKETVLDFIEGNK